ncbi:hypothetical protein [Moorella sp. E306M]|uniref:hypothetical protein n=1 Tax=Moorella sp. E306M TaxID=2572683 RepID=UPI0010FFAD5D|nr:hypothetical protein [Moorella sp. E306M]GEA17532.1 hypothetical protein E306M_06660 [Moorella sp. E306M]
MPLYLIRVTAKREGSQISTAREEVVQELPPDSHYWDAAAKVFLDQMIAEGLLPGPEQNQPREVATYNEPECRRVS